MNEIIAELLEQIIFRYRDYFLKQTVNEDIINVWKVVEGKLNLIIKDLRSDKDE